MTALSDSDSFGLNPVPQEYRSFVGPAADYDVLGALQFTALFALGMREWHRVADVGCGSLRAGRLLIPYLLPDRYFGIEPAEWLVTDGLRQELGPGIVEVKRPSFSDRDDFDLGSFGVAFDYILAQSIFSHTYEDLATSALSNLAGSLSPSGMLLATYVDYGDSPRSREGSGWEYPGCVRYNWSDFSALLGDAGLDGVRLSWPHPRQTWVVAARHGSVRLPRKARAARRNLGSNLQHPALLSLRRRVRSEASALLPVGAKRALRARALAYRSRRRAGAHRDEHRSAT